MLAGTGLGECFWENIQEVLRVCFEGGFGVISRRQESPSSIQTRLLIVEAAMEVHDGTMFRAVTQKA